MSKLSDNPEVKERIKKEFLQCMNEMPYSKITVKKLVERVGMSRQNLYRYYLSKDDILLDMIDDTLDQAYVIIELNLNNVDQNLGLIASSLEELIIPQKELINEILGGADEQIVLSHLNRFVRRVAGRWFREHAHKGIDHDYLDIVIAQYSGAGYHMMRAWAQIDDDLDPKKITTLVSRYVEGAFTAISEAMSPTP